MKKTFSVLPLIGLLSFGSFYTGAAGITKLEQNTRTVERQSVSFASIGQSSTRTIWITGPWMDWVDVVNSSGGVAGTIKSTKMGIGTGEVQIILNASSTATRGEKTLSVHVKCPVIPLDCSPGPFSFKVRVFETGPITSISPSGTVTPNGAATYTLSGSGLNVAELLPRLTALKNATIVSKSASTMVVSGTNPSCGGVDIELIDVDGLEDIPYRKASGLTLPVAGGACGTFSSTSLSGTSTRAGPDLQPISGTPVFRHIAPIRKLSGEAFCNGMFAQAVQAIVKTITVPDMTWGVKNTGGTTVATPFHVQLFRNGVLVRDMTVASLNPGASVSFSYTRPQSHTEVARLGLVPPSTTQQLYQSTGGECVQTVGQESQYNWQDPQYEIRVDPTNVVAADTNKTNNNRSF